MQNIDDIVKNYPPKLQPFRQYILKEYLQYKILNIIYSSNYSSNLVFIGDTAIRIIHGSTRFSEDLDFDNVLMKEKDLETLSFLIKKELELEGYIVETKNVYKNAFHCYIRFPGILFKQELSGYKEEKILIQIDMEPQNYKYSPDNYLINKFGLFRYLNVAPGNLLLSQKISACLLRKRAKGRDFFDVVYLMSSLKPDWEYLKQVLNIGNKKEITAAAGTCASLWAVTVCP